MFKPVDQAPCDVPLILVEIRDPIVKDRLGRMGVHAGDRVTRMSDEAVVGPVRVEGPVGEVVLASGMAAKVIAHHDDGHKTPLSEMLPGETGHVEGLVCGTALEKSLAVLGIREGDSIRMVRRVPPMEYRVVVEGRRVLLMEGEASKVWGEMDGREMQFAMAGGSRPFTVKMLLGGRRAVAFLERKGVCPGRTITLDSVAPARSLGQGMRGHTVVTTGGGLRLYLRPDQAAGILVRSISGP